MVKIHAEAAPSCGKTLLEVRIPSSLEWMTALVVRLVKLGIDEKLILEEDRDRMEVCCEEALKNSIIHGNQENSKKWVTVRMFRDGEDWGVTFSDEGQGFGPERITDPQDPDFPWMEHGRGIHMLRALMDRIEYFSGGRTLVCRRKVSGQASRSPAASRATQSQS